MTTKESKKSWTTAGALDELKTIHERMEDRSFAFILGSGASFNSGIPTGKILAETWLRDLHLRECSATKTAEEWVANGSANIPGLTWDSAANYYPRIFERRFEGDRESGYAALENAMDGKEPSLGYSLLAEILQSTRHKVVVTTNFDNLVAEALAVHAHKPPLIVGHESLTGFVRPQLRRPLVAKIHRDLLLQPINHQNGVDTLEKGWHDALKRLFQYYMPIVIGYGGNDGSLMGFLNALNTDDIAGRLIWCHMENEVPSDAVQDVVEKLSGVMVPISGFDEFMIELAGTLLEDFEMSQISTRIEDLGKKRADGYRTQAEKLQKKMSGAVNENDQETSKVPLQVLDNALKDDSNWWTWHMRATAESDINKKEKIYLQALDLLPNDPLVHYSYGMFLTQSRKDYVKAKHELLLAIKLDPNIGQVWNGYAVTLWKMNENFEVVRDAFLKSLALTPDNENAAGDYAQYLATTEQNNDEALMMFKKALLLNPNHVPNVCNYAMFLSNDLKNSSEAEKVISALYALSPENSEVASTYAYVIEEKNPVAAQHLYEQAIKAGPKNFRTLSLYAYFLFMKGDVEGAYENYVKIKQTDTDDEYLSANFAMIQIVRGDLEGGRESATHALSFSNGNTQARVEAMFYLALLNAAENKQNNEILKQLKAQLSKSFARARWNLDLVLKVMLEKINPNDHEFFIALAAAVLDEDAVASLSNYKIWNELSE